MKEEKILIVGKTASGKDFLAKWFESKGFKKSVMHTTRPIRKNEEDGYTYHYISDDKFEEMINEDSLHEWDSFIGWYYGSTKQDFKDSQVFIKTPNGVSKLSEEDRKKCFIIYLDMSDEIILERLKDRNDNNDSIERRMKTDKEDFENFNDYDLRITDGEYDPEFILSLIV